MNKDCIFLIGYMGSGKSTVGKMLQANTDWDFVDMDEYIEKKHNMTVQDIFAEKGENAFREIERQTLEELLRKKKLIVATGGGVPCFNNNMQLINRHAVSVYLKFAPEDLALRLEISGVEKRPLLQNRRGADLLQFVKKSLADRVKYYEQATVSVEGTDEEIYRQILKYTLE